MTRPDYVPCFVCNRPSHEKHHVMPKHVGGESGVNLVPLCLGCHDLVDRVPLAGWAPGIFFEIVNGVESWPPNARLTMLKMFKVLMHRPSSAA